jgi:thiopeptide-type bacteriocin biosynthesis protein
VIKGVWSSCYEPERYAFGGGRGMAIAHRLFHADSTSFLNDLLSHLRQGEHPDTGPGIIERRELSILVCTAMLRGAEQDWHEQGDVWDRVAQMRLLPAGKPIDRFGQMADSLHTLLPADTSHRGALMRDGGPLGFAASCARAFTEAGRALRAAADTGDLDRGLRDVLAHHVIFAWNRHGLAARRQAVLARAARHTVMHPPASTDETTNSPGTAR